MTGVAAPSLMKNALIAVTIATGIQSGVNAFVTSPLIPSGPILRNPAAQQDTNASKSYAFNAVDMVTMLAVMTGGNATPAPLNFLGSPGATGANEMMRATTSLVSSSSNLAELPGDRKAADIKLKPLLQSSINDLPSENNVQIPKLSDTVMTPFVKSSEMPIEAMKDFRLPFLKPFMELVHLPWYVMKPFVAVAEQLPDSAATAGKQLRGKVGELGRNPEDMGPKQRIQLSSEEGLATTLSLLPHGDFVVSEIQPVNQNYGVIASENNIQTPLLEHTVNKPFLLASEQPLEILNNPYFPVVDNVLDIIKGTGEMFKSTVGML